MNQTSEIPFSKLEGTGNDFILVDNRAGLIGLPDLPNLVPAMCNRTFGIGSDGLILLEEDESGTLVMIYKNPDGSDAGMCGNGARCFALFAKRLGYASELTFRVHDKTYESSLTGQNVSIRFPLTTDVQPVSVDGEEFLNIYTNTEHIVCRVDAGLLDHPGQLVSRGRHLRNHEAFEPKGTNVNFIHGTGETELELQTYERGVENLTLACGTGAIASALAWHAWQTSGDGTFTYQVQTRGGTLLVRFKFNAKSGRYSEIELEGPATFVFEGRYPLKKNGD
ncbi:MAG: diaminopimelate epimerase [Balneolaceae bacterium]